MGQADRVDAVAVSGLAGVDVLPPAAHAHLEAGCRRDEPH